MTRGNCNHCHIPVGKNDEYEIIHNTKGYGVLCGKCSANLTKRAEKARKKIALTKEDILKYGTKDEILFLEATKKKKKVCARCGKPLKKGDTGKVCDMCAEDINMGRDRE